MPVTSITSASFGIFTAAAVPIAVILPPDMTNTPPSIVPCETVSSFPPLSTRVFCCAREVEEKKQSDEMTNNCPTTKDQRPRTEPNDRRPKTDDCVILPPCSAAYRSPVTSGQNKCRHRSEPCSVRRSWREGNHPRSQGRRPFPRQSSPHDRPRR